jgi:hypothetical protein
VPWTHHKSISNRNATGAFDLKMTSPVGLDGFTGSWVTGPRAGQLGPQATSFTAPCYMKACVRCVCVCVFVDVYACRVWVSGQAVSPSEAAEGVWVSAEGHWLAGLVYAWLYTG